MDAGRELDAEVAEKVMGWTVLRLPRHSGAHSGDIELWEASDVPGDPWPLSMYSTSIADAWQVVEHMHSAGHHLVLWLDDISGPQPQWGARLPKGLMGRHETHHANTAPLAICRAALAVATQ